MALLREAALRPESQRGRVEGGLRVGVVGAGIGRAHIEAYQSLRDQFKVVTLCDIDEARARSVADEMGVPRISTDLGEHCGEDDLDIIDICTPSHLHAPQTLEALSAGKHVVCEKPVAGSLRAVDEIIAAEARSGKRVMPIFQNRFGHGLQKLKLLVDSGVAGTPYLATIETAWRRRASYYVRWRGRWATELGGALVTLAIHAHDALYYICGPARTVFARTATLVNPIETEDTVVASLEMQSGALVSLSVTTGSPAEVSRWRFCFSELSAESHTAPYASATDPWQFTPDSEQARLQMDQTLSRFVPQPEGLAGQFARFRTSLRDGTELPVTLADARASLELITAIYFSAATSEDVVLPINADHPMYGGWQTEAI